jgi:hypothetical protein
MNNKKDYYKVGDKAVAMNYKVASSSLAVACLKAESPDLYASLHTEHGDGNGTAYPEGKSFETIMPHPFTEKIKVQDSEAVYLVVREPIEKFRSACRMSKIAPNKALDKLIGDDLLDPHFQLQSRFVKTKKPVHLYKLEDVEQMAEDLGLETPLPTRNQGSEEEKPELTPEELRKVKKYYRDDIELYNSITEAGMLYEF